MKKFSLLVLAVLSLSAPAFAATVSSGYVQMDPFTGDTRAINTNVVYAAVPPGAQVNLISVTADAANVATLKVYKVVGAGTTVTNALALGASNVLVTATNTLEVGAHVLLRSVASGNFQKALVHSVAADGIVITNYPGAGLSQADFALAVGDMVYRLTNSGTIKLLPVGITTIGTGATICGDTMPSVVEVAQTGLCTNLSLLVGGVK